MTKSYRKVRLKKNRVYSVGELREVYSATANTVTNWVNEGLKPSDGQTPYRFRGEVVMAFHKSRRSTFRRGLCPGEFHCRGCQSPVFPAISSIQEFFANNGKHMYRALCPDCSKALTKISAETDRDLIEKFRNPKTPTSCQDEEKTAERGDIGTTAPNTSADLYFANDRIIHRWQMYAEGYSEKTIEKHLIAIRYIEKHLDGKCFTKLTIDDFVAFRADLKRRSSLDAEDRLSASTIRHIVSHICNFINWLLTQDGYRRLPKDFAGYLKLPKAVLARSAQVQQKQFPTLAEAEALLRGMPTISMQDQRARALFGLAFLGALRADTLVSLRIKHIDLKRRLILQDAGVVRAKAGKSINIAWFKIPALFEDVLMSWIKTLQRLGYCGDDALFPKVKDLTTRVRLGAGRSNAIPVMTTTHAVTDAFAIACRDHHIKYTPHAAKHTIGAERDIRPLTHEERKAWSLNMGHDSETTTDLHYATMSDEKRFEVLENIGTRKKIDAGDLTDEDKIRLVDKILSELLPIY